MTMGASKPYIWVTVKRALKIAVKATIIIFINCILMITNKSVKWLTANSVDNFITKIHRQNSLFTLICSRN